jgi:hypothetical protein
MIRTRRALCIGVAHDNAKFAEDDALRVARALWGCGYEVDVRDRGRLGWMTGPAYDLVYYSCEAIVTGEPRGVPLLFLNDPTVPSPWMVLDRVPLGKELTVFDCCHVGSRVRDTNEDNEGGLCLCAGREKTFNSVHAGSFFAAGLVAAIADRGRLPLGAELPDFAEHIQRYVTRAHKVNQLPYDVQQVTVGWL